MLIAIAIVFVVGIFADTKLCESMNFLNTNRETNVIRLYSKLSIQHSYQAMEKLLEIADDCNSTHLPTPLTIGTTG